MTASGATISTTARAVSTAGSTIAATARAAAGADRFLDCFALLGGPAGALLLGLGALHCLIRGGALLD